MKRRYLPKDAPENVAIIAARQAGQLYKVIAAEHGITQERARQICIAADPSLRRWTRSDSLSPSRKD